MSMKLEEAVPWGRLTSEYIAMLALTPQDMNGRILDCAGGPSSFNAEMTRQGRQVMSIDPLYQFTEDEIGFVKVVAGQAAIAIENARLMSETLEMKRTLEARKLIERAKGILQQKYGLTEEEAYLRLRNESRRLRRPMRDLAEAVILADDLEKKKGVEA